MPVMTTETINATAKLDVSMSTIGIKQLAYLMLLLSNLNRTAYLVLSILVIGTRIVRLLTGK